jgi:hypothetical protein
MAQEQVLGLKPAARLEQVDDEHPKRLKDREHRPNDAMILPPAPSPKPG